MAQHASFHALRISEAGGSTATSVVGLTEADLRAVDVAAEVGYSDLNFKDGRFMEPGSTLPAVLLIIPAIDFAGVLANGFGRGTDRDGGLTQRTRVPGAWLLPIPRGLDEKRAAATGTAGYTAALAVDALVGSRTLATVLSETRYGGAVAAVGLEEGMDLPSSVLPLVLRGVSLLGMESVYASMPRRQRAWARAADLDHELLDSIPAVVGLADAPPVSQDIVAGGVHGRVVVDVHS